MSEDKGHKIFIGGLSLDTTQESLTSYFEEFGAIEDAVVMVDGETKRCRGFGFVTFTDQEAHDKAIEQGSQERHVIDGKQVEVKHAVPRTEMSSGGGGGGGSSYNSREQHSTARTKKIFLGGLSIDTSQKDVIDAIDGILGEGYVQTATIMTEKDTGKPRGFGFAIMKDPSYATDDPEYETRAYAVAEKLVKENPYIKILDRDVELKPAQSVDEMKRRGGPPRGGQSSRSNYSSNYSRGGQYGYGPGDSMGMYGGQRFDSRMGYPYGTPTGYADYYRSRADYVMPYPMTAAYDRTASASYHPSYDTSGSASYDAYKQFYGSAALSASYPHSTSGYGPTRNYDYKERSDRGDSRSYHPYTRR